MSSELNSVAPRNCLPILSLLAATAISQTGLMLTVVALPWFVLQTTDSPARAGLVGFATLVPRFLSGIFGGVFVDQLGYRRVIIASDLFSGGAIMMVPLLYHTLGLAFWQLLSFAFLSSLLTIPNVTARRSIVPDLTELADMGLERVNSIFESLQHVARLLGPPLAGVLIVWLGASHVLWITAAALAVAAAIVASAIASPSRSEPEETAEETYWTRIGAGFRFLIQDRLLLWLAIVLTTSNMLHAAMTPVILPVFVGEQLNDATSLGLLIASLGAGALVGASIYAAIGQRLPRRLVFVAAFMLAPIEYWVLILNPSLPVIMLTFVLVGIVFGPVNPLLVTIRHERIPAELRGRVFSLFSTMAVTSQPLGVLVAGFAVDSIGILTTLLAFAAIAHLLALTTLLLPILREMGAPGRHRSLDSRDILVGRQ
jgi:MFS family permease